ncbi:SpoIIE family protein phosphatase [Allonocardiopsis opalescens]|uniref:protein-serine/threonine phosphatase n=1 Tax=Allonocardiopsis opalescens TaxID=1144618 RepID=A0A2T0Q7A0_9ACTN|nr:SpoIIE family protein phosphatase [Allonocardiopsis opalescens]PRX99705.1 PAS domain S-box-containing protein [Allonocardiopsis opalescens]
MAGLGEDGHVPAGARADPELAHKVMAGLNAAVYTTDEQERIVAVNPRAEELLGRSAAECVGRDAHELLHRDARGRTLPRARCQVMAALLTSAVAQGGSKWFARGDGTVLPVVWIVTPYEGPDGTAAAAVIFDRRDAGAEERPAEDAAEGRADIAADLSLLTEVTEVLTSTLEVAEALRRLVRLVTPRLADWAVIDLIREDDELERVAVVRCRDGVHTRMPEFEGPLPPVPAASAMPLSRVLRGAPATRIRAEDYTVPPDTGLAVAQRELFTRAGLRTAVAASLRGPLEGVFGALTLGRGGPRPDFTTTELALVEDIARRAGHAMEHARLYERQRRVAETMQRYLLPPMPEVPGLEMGALYRPAAHTAEVGGDWYDTFMLPDGATTLVIGDVVGHDLQAAAHMAEVRTLLRAFAWDHEEPPSMIIGRLDQALLNISRVPMVTLVFARVEGEPDGPRRLRWSNAGHPPPLVVGWDGQTRFLDGEQDALLGTGVPLQRVDTVTPLAPMSVVLFYTDGLVEVPGRSLDEGLDRLRATAATLARRPLGDFCDRLVERVATEQNRDDIALIAVRVLGTAGTAPAAAVRRPPG